jgi:flagellar hook-basal body complex protein FliE
MAIGAIRGVGGRATQALNGSTARVPASGAGEAVETFGRLLNQALEDLNRVNHESNEAMVRLSAGEPVELHDVMIAMEQADLSLRLALQVRNKLVEAYQEVQRMQV